MLSAHRKRILYTFASWRWTANKRSNYYYSERNTIDWKNSAQWNFSWKKKKHKKWRKNSERNKLKQKLFIFFSFFVLEMRKVSRQQYSVFITRKSIPNRIVEERYFSAEASISAQFSQSTKKPMWLRTELHLPVTWIRRLSVDDLIIPQATKAFFWFDWAQSNRSKLFTSNSTWIGSFTIEKIFMLKNGKWKTFKFNCFVYMTIFSTFQPKRLIVYVVTVRVRYRRKNKLKTCARVMYSIIVLK